MGRRRRAREIALQVLYRLDLNPTECEEALGESESFRQAAKTVQEFARELAAGTRERLSEVDRLIEDAALRWGMGRMAVVDRNVLRLACYEMLAHPETPVRVVLNEAIELAKAYGGEESGTFVNGVLDRVRLDLGRADN